MRCTSVADVVAGIAWRAPPAGASPSAAAGTASPGVRRRTACCSTCPGSTRSTSPTTESRRSAPAPGWRRCTPRCTSTVARACRLRRDRRHRRPHARWWHRAARAAVRPDLRPARRRRRGAGRRPRDPLRHRHRAGPLLGAPWRRWRAVRRGHRAAVRHRCRTTDGTRAPAVPGRRHRRAGRSWQSWAPDAPDELTLGLTVARDPGGRASAVLAAACLLGETATRDLLAEFASLTLPGVGVPDVRAGVPYHRLKSDLDDPREHLERHAAQVGVLRTSPAGCDRRSGRWTCSPNRTRRHIDGSRFTALGGAYNRVARRRDGVRPPQRAIPARARRRRSTTRGSTRRGRPRTPMGPDACTRNFPDPALDDPSVGVPRHEPRPARRSQGRLRPGRASSTSRRRSDLRGAAPVRQSFSTSKSQDATYLPWPAPTA